MNTWLQRLFAIPPELADQPWHVTFRLQPSAWMLLILGLAVIMLATWGYIRLRGSRLRRGMLAAARAGSIAFVLALILQPVIEWPREREELDSVIVLVDRSRSMEVRDERTPGGGGESRDARTRRLLADPVWERIGQRHQLSWFGFGGSATPLQDPSEPGASSADRTLLQASLQQALRAMEGRTVGSIVVLSDGRSQDGLEASSLEALRRSGISVFVVPVGDVAGGADRAVVEVDHPQRAFARDRIPVKATIRAREGPVTVVLRDRIDGRELDRIETQAGSDGRVAATLTGTRAGDGDAAWEVVIEPIGSDVDPGNDRMEVDITSIDRPIRVLYLDGRPRWEFRYLRSILLRESGVESSIMLLSADRDFAQEGTLPISRLPSTKEEFEPFDVMVIGDVPSGAIDPARQRIIREQVARRGMGIVWIGGERSMPGSWEGSVLQELLPFRGSLDLPRWDEPVFMQPTSEAGRLGLLPLGDVDGSWPTELGSEPWAKLEWAQRLTADRIKPTAETWALATGAGDPRPLVVSLRFGAGTSVYVATDETWRWRYGRGETLQERFWVPMIRHLARLGLSGDPGMAMLTVDPPSCITSQPVRVTLDAAGKFLVDDVVVEAKRRDGVEMAEIRLVPDGSGRFASTWFPDRDGIWDLRVTQPEVDGVSPASLQVRPEDMEALDTSPDHRTLTSLAAGTGGGTVPPEEISSLDRRLPSRSVMVRQPIQLPLWDRWFVYAVLMILLVAEWTARRLMRFA